MIYIENAPSEEVVNTVGSGNSTIAGFMAGIEKNMTKLEVFKLIVQSGSATVFNEALATKRDILVLNGKIDVEKNTVESKQSPI